MFPPPLHLWASSGWTHPAEETTQQSKETLAMLLEPVSELATSVVIVLHYQLNTKQLICHKFWSGIYKMAIEAVIVDKGDRGEITNQLLI